MEILQIDIKEILKKESRFLAKIPFFGAWLKRTIHQDEMNECLRSCGHLHGNAFAAAVLEFFQIRVEVVFTVPLDTQKGRYIFAANHPQGGIDGVALIKAISDTFPEVRFPVNSILLHLKNFDPILLPIKKNQKGSQDRALAEKIKEAYASHDQQILVFPAGLVSRKTKGKIEDLQWKKNFIITKAIEHERNVVPVYIDGRNSDRFYRFANWRKRLWIKLNIESLYLPDEMFQQKNKTIRIIVGKPISYKIFEKPIDKASKKSSGEDVKKFPKAMYWQTWADYIKKKAYNLANLGLDG